MDKYIITGNTQLKGTIDISGSKNGALALIPATILAPGAFVIRNIPELADINTISKIMTAFGTECTLNHNELFINTANITNLTAEYDLVRKMRASFNVLGPLLAMYGKAKVSLPGGCA